MGIELLGKTGGTVTAMDDGTLLRGVFENTDRILSGCVLSTSGSNKINITDGYMVVCGRLIKVTAQTINVALATTGTQTLSIFVKVRPNNVAPVMFLGGYTASDNINVDEDGTYDGYLCTYSATTTNVLSVSAKMPGIRTQVSTIISKASSQSIENATEKTVTFNDVEGTDLTWTNSGNKVGFIIPDGYGSAVITAKILFGVNNTGARKVLIYRGRSGADIEIARQSMAAVLAEVTSMTVSVATVANAGDVFYATVYQSTGGALNVLAGSAISIVLL